MTEGQGRKIFTIEFGPDLTEADAKEIVSHLVTLIRSILFGQFYKFRGTRVYFDGG